MRRSNVLSLPPQLVFPASTKLISVSFNWKKREETSPHAILCSSMDKFELTGQNLGWVFNSRRGHAGAYHLITLITKTVQLKDENSAQMTLRFSPVCFRPPQLQSSVSIKIIELITAASSLRGRNVCVKIFTAITFNWICSFHRHKTKIVSDNNFHRIIILWLYRTFSALIVVSQC